MSQYKFGILKHIDISQLLHHIAIKLEPCELNVKSECDKTVKNVFVTVQQVILRLLQEKMLTLIGCL